MDNANMAEDKYSGLAKEVINIAADHDVIVRVVEYKEVMTEKGKKVVPEKLHDFEVNSWRLTAASTYFNSLLRGKFKESQQSLVELHGDSHQAIKVWLSILEDKKEMLKVTHHETTFLDVWQTLEAAHKYELDPKSSGAKLWFAEWLEVNSRSKSAKEIEFSFEEFQQLLFPCYTFDHIFGFAAATEFLAYNSSGHIVEKRPGGFKLEHLRMDQNIMQQINAARGRLKTILHRELYSPIGVLLKFAKCDCKEKTLWAYEKALHDTGAWPLETAYARMSMNDILRSLGKFKDPAPPKEECRDCPSIAKATVTRAINETRAYFDGLCLDCMNASKPKFENEDEDYWRHAERRNWDEKCRINHGEPSWYFSFLGRREKMIQWNKRHRRY